MKICCRNERQPQHRRASLAHSFQQRTLDVARPLQVKTLQMLWMLMLVSEEISFPGLQVVLCPMARH
jgi:hypothetical protein